jgi:anaerobic magnesium-protoporphyrin IX monomethyl ester cyclase
VDGIPFPAWEEFDLSKFPGTNPHGTQLELPMITGRGCPFNCIFCCRYLGNKCRRRSVDSVIAEITRNVDEFGCEAIAFLDDTFILNMKWTEEFFEKMRKTGLDKKIKWSCTTRVSDATPDLLKKMKSAGCYYVFFGFESANDYILKIAKKAIKREQILKAVEWTKHCGIIPSGSFIIGLPGDTEESILDTIEFGKMLDLYSITFPIATPFPGSELREMALRNDYGMNIRSSDWSDYLANDLDKYGKMNIRVLESDDLPWEKRIELQKIGYERNPKKKISEYAQRLIRLPN